MLSLTRARLAPLVLGVALVAAACSSDSDDTAAGASSAPPATTATESTEPVVNDTEAAQLELLTLPVVFTQGMDAIGRLDPDRGAEIFAGLYTDEAVTDMTFPDGSNFVVEGPQGFAGFVGQLFGGNGYVTTQHLVGSIDAAVDPGNPNQATVSFELHATHVRPDGTVDIANGTWVNTAVRSSGSWQFDSQTMQVLSFGLRDDTTREQLEDLLVTGFAQGMDAIGGLDIERGTEIFAGLLTADAVTEMTFPDGSNFVVTGPEEFAGFVQQFFGSAGYVSTQHNVGNFDIDIAPGNLNQATINFELIAFHHRADGTIDLGNGRWVATAERTEEGWRLTSQTLQSLFFGAV